MNMMMKFVISKMYSKIVLSYVKYVKPKIWFGRSKIRTKSLKVMKNDKKSKKV